MCNCSTNSDTRLVMTNPFHATSSSSTMLDDSTKKILTRAALTGGVLAAAGAIAYGNGSVGIAGMSVPAAVPLALSGAAGSIIADKAAGAIHDALPKDAAQKIADVSDSLIGAAVCGVSSAGILRFGFGLPDSVLLQAGGLGSISFLALDYVTRKFLEDDMGHLIF